MESTQFANVTCGTIRLKLLKIGARVTISVRRVKIAMTVRLSMAKRVELAHAFLSRETECWCASDAGSVAPNERNSTATASDRGFDNRNVSSREVLNNNSAEVTER